MPCQEIGSLQKGLLICMIVYYVENVTSVAKLRSLFLHFSDFVIALAYLQVKQHIRFIIA